MLTLAFDTATDHLSVAAGDVGRVPEEAHLEGARKHAAGILPLIQAVLARLDARPRDIGRIIVADGPGSFTGLRVGVSVAKAMISCNPVPLFTAPSLLARALPLAGPGCRTVLSVAGALRGEVFAAVFRFNSDPVAPIETLLEPSILGVDALAALFPANAIVGDGPEEMLEELSNRWGVFWTRGPQSMANAAALLALVDVPGSLREIATPATWEPNYGRQAEAQVKWEHAHGRSLPNSPHASA